MQNIPIAWIAAFVSAGVISTVSAIFIRRIAAQLRVVDVPDERRKLHRAPVPLLGGAALMLGFFITVFLFAKDIVFAGNITEKALWGLLAGSALLCIGGFLDDKFSLRPSLQIIWPIAAALVAVASGIAPKEITNPMGGTFAIGNSILAIGSWTLTLGHVFAFVWLMGMMYTTKLLDGLDGLATGVGGIGAFMIFGIAASVRFFQPDVGFLALALAGACMGFLIWNFYPARIFLGEGGSLWIGFALGGLAIISGGKIATALLVVGAPAIDVALVVARRLRMRTPVVLGDLGHLHYRLRSVGFGDRQTVFFLWAIAAGFGILTLFLQSRGKLLAILLLFALTIFLSAVLSRKKNL